MKKVFLVCALALGAALIAGCLKDSSTGTSDIVATEAWSGVMNNDSGANNNAITFQKKSDGSIVASADWQFGTVHCPFTNGILTIADSVLSVTASGTATNTNPNIPAGYNTSPFTVSVTDTVKNGHGHGRWTIHFSTPEWPTSLQGTETISRTSGSGIISGATDTSVVTVVATEAWTGVMNNDSAANNNAITFQKKSDGSIVCGADWQFLLTVHCPFTNGIVTIVDSVLSVTASGIATNTDPSIPVPSNTSPFTVSVIDTVKNGQGHGRWVIRFLTDEWPDSLQGTETISRTSGSGITN